MILEMFWISMHSGNGESKVGRYYVLFELFELWASITNQIFRKKYSIWNTETTVVKYSMRHFISIFNNSSVESDPFQENLLDYSFCYLLKTNKTLCYHILLNHNCCSFSDTNSMTTSTYEKD